MRYNLTRTNSDAVDVVIPGELAVQCLREMPFDKERAVAFVKEYRKYLQYQSTIEILPNPPANYPMPPTDLLGGLDDIQKKAKTGLYNNQFDFDTAISDLLKSAYDGHLGASLCSQQYFVFENDTPLVSVSSNGTALPQVYTYSDALQLHSQSSVSPIASINGADVTDYLLSLGTGSQDWDALYNAQFKSLALSLNVHGRSNSLQGRFTNGTWSGAYHMLRFANGSNSVVETTTTVKNFPFENGTSFWENVCLPKNTSNATPKILTSTPNLGAPAGYPKPTIREGANRIMGFLPDSKGLEDVAVLAVPTFAESLEKVPILNGAADFAKIARDFIHNATSAGKKKMIIDLCGNGGGSVYSGMNLFRLFFPNKDIYSAGRWRAHESADLAGQVVSFFPSGPIWLNWKSQVKPDQETDFKSWKELFGPHTTLGVPSSSLVSNNLSLGSSSTEPISGYGPIKLDPTRSAFKAEDIILLTDGYCASTCTIFSELMKAEGVRTIAFGGRPHNAPMQGMGGVKGSQTLPLTTMSKLMEQAASLIRAFSNSSEPIVASKDMDHFDDIFPKPLEKFPLNLTEGAVNLMNAFGPTNDSLPRQFIYEAAECRRFFTLDNIRAPETLWASAADAMFHGGECVLGSMNGTGSLWPKKPSIFEKLLGSGLLDKDH
ncbi:unnamed protein product [Penicillium olsonii]|nr:unnamed protein product [Penicillium olsonii]